MDRDLIVDVDNKMTQFLLHSDIPEAIQRANGDRARCNINLDQLRSYDKVLSEFAFKNPEKCIIMLEKKLNQMMEEKKDDTIDEKMRTQARTEQFPTKPKTNTVNFIGSFGRNHITPRGLKANMLNKLVKVQGIVTRMSVVHPKLTKSYHYVEATKSGLVRKYNDQYSINEDAHVDRSTHIPNIDPLGNRMTLDYGFCNYKKTQRLVIQELPERAPPGQLPRSVSVILEDDLVDLVKPGDRVEITGVYKTVPGQRSTTSGVFQTLVFGTGVEKIKNNVNDEKLDATDIKNIKKEAQRKDIFDVLANSVAPSIYGHHRIKKGLLLQLLGGTRHTVQGTGTRIRGDINMLLVGDPSTAKSQLLRQMMEIAPLAINTTGRGSSGVGLTAAVIVDPDTGDRHLEAGAMVLADKGVVCIDEFDKMNDADRVAIHEVMEQQTVTISKAGIHASLNARCSVVAAANPIYGDYDQSVSAAKNIGLPDSLLSRFDLLFVVLDDKSTDVNNRIAEKVIMNHRYKRPGEKKHIDLNHDDHLVESEVQDDNNDSKRKVYENDFENFIAGNNSADSVTNDVLDRSFLKKYLSYAKSTINPVMDEGAVEFLSSSYSLLRQKGQDKDNFNDRKLPITARTLETLIRLATAHAKIRLSQKVTVNDMKTALQLLNYSIFNKDENDDVKDAVIEENEENEDEEEEIKFDGASKRMKQRETRSGNLKANLSQARKARLLNKENVNTANSQRVLRSSHLSSKEQVEYVFEKSISTTPKGQRLSVTEGHKKYVYKLLTILKSKHSKAD